MGGRGADAIEEAIRIARFAMAAETLGTCEAAVAQTIDHLRSVVLGAAETLAGPATAHARADVAAAAAMAAESGDLAGREAIHPHGAIGMTGALGIGRHLLRIQALIGWLGDAQHLRETYLRIEEEENAA